ncbi:unnamed protein product [Pedinophyceae sp. YPF-701]|nr:unnamed protein product [Pedinophyceae sp. YPF-701]
MGDEAFAAGAVPQGGAPRATLEELEAAARVTNGRAYHDRVSYDMAQWLRKRGRPMRPKLSRRQRKELKECFDFIDEDESGAIELEELMEAFNLLGLDISVQEAKRMMQVVDRDDSGAVEFPEFIEIMTSTLAEQTQDPAGKNIHKREPPKKPQKQKDRFQPLPTREEMQRDRSAALRGMKARAHTMRMLHVTPDAGAGAGGPAAPGGAAAEAAGVSGQDRNLHAGAGLLSERRKVGEAAPLILPGRTQGNLLPFNLVAQAYRRMKILDALSAGDQDMTNRLVERAVQDAREQKRQEELRRQIAAKREARARQEAEERAARESELEALRLRRRGGARASYAGAAAATASARKSQDNALNASLLRSIAAIGQRALSVEGSDGASSMQSAGAFTDNERLLGLSPEEVRGMALDSDATILQVPPRNSLAGFAPVSGQGSMPEVASPRRAWEASGAGPWVRGTSAVMSPRPATTGSQRVRVTQASTLRPALPAASGVESESDTPMRAAGSMALSSADEGDAAGAHTELTVHAEISLDWPGGVPPKPEGSEGYKSQVRRRGRVSASSNWAEPAASVRVRPPAKYGRALPSNYVWTMPRNHPVRPNSAQAKSIDTGRVRRRSRALGAPDSSSRDASRSRSASRPRRDGSAAPRRDGSAGPAAVSGRPTTAPAGATRPRATSARPQGRAGARPETAGPHRGRSSAVWVAQQQKRPEPPNLEPPFTVQRPRVSSTFQASEDRPASAASAAAAPARGSSARAASARGSSARASSAKGPFKSLLMCTDSLGSNQGDGAISTPLGSPHIGPSSPPGGMLRAIQESEPVQHHDAAEEGGEFSGGMTLSRYLREQDRAGSGWPGPRSSGPSARRPVSAAPGARGGGVGAEDSMFGGLQQAQRPVSAGAATWTPLTTMAVPSALPPKSGRRQRIEAVRKMRAVESRNPVGALMRLRSATTRAIATASAELQERERVWAQQ